MDVISGALLPLFEKELLKKIFGLKKDEVSRYVRYYKIRKSVICAGLPVLLR
jgi:hypothetical protein